MLFNLPNEIIDKIMGYATETSLPTDIIQKIMLYNSHPVADLFKEAIKDKVDELNEIIPGYYEYGGGRF